MASNNVGTISKVHEDSFVRNVLVSLGTHVGSTLAVLLVTPIFVSSLGLEAYGLWALLSSVVRYGFLADFGLGPTITKYVSEYIARGDYQRVRRLCSFGVMFSLAMGLIVTLLVSVFAQQILSIFRLTTQQRGFAPEYLTALTAFLFLFMASNVLTALLKGFGRLDLSASAAAIGQVFFAAFGVIFVLHGMGVRGLLYAAYLQLAVQSCLNYYHLRRRQSAVFGNPLCLDGKEIRKLFRMSGWVQLSVLFGFASAETDTVVVGAFVGIAAVGIFDIGTKLSRALLALSWHFNNAFLPAISALEVRSGTDATERSAELGSRYLGLFSVALAGFLICAAPLILKAWLGNTVGHAQTIVAIIATMCIAFILSNINSVSMTALVAVGKPRLQAVYGAVSATTKLMLVLLLAPRFGIPGILAATIIAALVATVFFFLTTRSKLGTYWRSVLNWAPRLVVATVIPTVIISLTVNHTSPVILSNRPAALVYLILLGVPYTIIILATLRLVGFFEGVDLRLLDRVARARGFSIANNKILQALVGSTVA